MSPITVLIIGGLSGSLGAAIFGRRIDVFQKRKDHERDLQKSFFSSKLNAAEEIAGYLTAALTMMNHVKLLYEMMRDGLEKGQANELRKLVMDNIAEAAKKGLPAEDSLKAAGQYNLYFGVESKVDFEYKAALIHLYMGELALVGSTVVNFDSSLYDDDRVAEDAYMKLIKELTEKMSGMIKLVGEAAQTIETRLNHLYGFYAEQKYLS